ncbi:hypothetical protein P9112_014222 [Eukaryota sp. TZLM1-RC]
MSFEVASKLESGYRAVSDEIAELKKQLLLQAKRRKSKSRRSSVASSPPQTQLNIQSPSTDPSPPPPAIDVDVVPPTMPESPVSPSPPASSQSTESLHFDHDFNTSSSRSASSPSSSFLKRQEYFDQQRRLRNEERKKQHDAQEATRARHTPQINPQSQSLNRSVSTLFSWKRDKELKKQKLAQERAQKSSEVKGTPRINPKSAEIMKSKPRTGKVENELLLSHFKKKIELELRQKQEEDEKLKQAKPNLSHHSSNLSRDGDVSDRLYSLSKNRRVEKEEVPPPDSEATFSPVINPLSKSMTRRVSVEDHLYQEAEAREERKRLLSKKIQNRSDSRFKPSPMTEKLAQNYDKRLGIKNSKDRIFRSKSAPKSRPEDDDNMSFKPKISRNSKNLVRQGGDRIEELYKEAQERKKKRDLKKLSEERQELLSIEESKRKSKMRIKKHSFNSDPLSEADLFDRQQMWLSRLESKRQHGRRAAAEEELESCTFAPDLSIHKPISDLSPIPYTKGTAAHLKRMETVRSPMNSSDIDLSVTGIDKKLVPSCLHCLFSFDESEFRLAFGNVIDVIEGRVVEQETVYKEKRGVSRPRTPRKRRPSFV